MIFLEYNIYILICFKSHIKKKKLDLIQVRPDHELTRQVTWV